MHRTVVRLYPWQEGKPVEVVADELQPGSKLRERITKVDELAKKNAESGKTYLLGEEGVYEFERIY